MRHHYSHLVVDDQSSAGKNEIETPVPKKYILKLRVYDEHQGILSKNMSSLINTIIK